MYTKFQIMFYFVKQRYLNNYTFFDLYIWNMLGVP